MARPILIRGDLALWYSPDEDGYYWQDGRGWGDKVSRLYRTIKSALRALARGTVKLRG